jgi:hypothetical protein
MLRQEERGTTILAGGQRDPLNHWDFYDVNGSKKVDSIDIAQVRLRFTGTAPTPPEDRDYDRRPGANPWSPNWPDGVINAVDISLVRASFNHSCLPPP